MGASANNVLYFAPHRMDGSGEVEMAFEVHLGNYSQKVTGGDGPKARDAWAYAKTLTIRNAVWDTKMSDAFGTPWINVSASFRDSLFDYCRFVNVP